MISNGSTTHPLVVQVVVDDVAAAASVRETIGMKLT
jgi:hypothetical protein